MQGIFARSVVAVGTGLAMMVAQGCRRQAPQAPARAMVLRVPRVQLDFPVGPLPVEDMDSGAVPRVERAELRRGRGGAGAGEGAGGAEGGGGCWAGAGSAGDFGRTPGGGA